jgi:4-hydroxy-tetrahydrodipicolinate reductase
VLDFQAYLGADAEDAVIIDGTPGVKMHIKGGIDGDYATGAVVVNAIPRVLAAEPGLITMLDLPMVRAF